MKIIGRNDGTGGRMKHSNIERGKRPWHQKGGQNGWIHCLKLWKKRHFTNTASFIHKKSQSKEKRGPNAGG